VVEVGTKDTVGSCAKIELTTSGQITNFHAHRSLDVAVVAAGPAAGGSRKIYRITVVRKNNEAKQEKGQQRY
jgi:hypothetical protein